MTNKKSNRKSYTVSVPLSIANRLELIKKLKGRKIDLGIEISKAISPMLTRLEKNMRVDKDTWKKAKRCPKCNSYLIPRKKGESEFYGCFNYPKCQHTENM